MIFYSCMPDDIVFDGWERVPNSTAEITVNGILMQVEPIAPSQARIVRLLSTDPRHFLNQAYAPGQLIAFSPALAE